MRKEFLKGAFKETRQYWPTMSLYERFEQVIAMVLVLVISVVVVVALLELIARVGKMLVLGAFDPLSHGVFQDVFGAIMTLLIAMEFKHSIIRVIERRENIIQVKTVILIAVLALARKFIIIDASQTEAATLAAMAVVMLALGVTYWLVRDRDRRSDLQAVDRRELEQGDARAGSATPPSERVQP